VVQFRHCAVIDSRTGVVVPDRPSPLESEKNNIVTVSSLIPQILSGLCWVIYGSFYEWYFHKFWMHVPRTPKEAFRGHTIVHHGLYKGDQSYFVPEDEHPAHILLKPYALPAIVLMHVPIMLLVERFIPHTFLGGIIATIVYFVVYEYTHWNMHVPRKHFIEKFRWFQFLRRHHHLHHKYFQKNFCVLFPLADVVFGTLITDASVARKKAEREQAIASGKIAEERNRPRRAEREARQIRAGARPHADNVALDGDRPRRVKESRRDRRIREVRAMQATFKPRRDR
jgi:hypothetical protein